MLSFPSLLLFFGGGDRPPQSRLSCPHPSLLRGHGQVVGVQSSRQDQGPLPLRLRRCQCRQPAASLIFGERGKCRPHARCATWSTKQKRNYCLDRGGRGSTGAWEKAFVVWPRKGSDQQPRALNPQSEGRSVCVRAPSCNALVILRPHHAAAAAVATGAARRPLA